MNREIIIKNIDEFEKNFQVASILVQTILQNLDTTKQNVYALSVFNLESNLNYDITINRKSFSDILQQNFQIHLDNEAFRQCDEIIQAIEYLKDGRGNLK